MSAPATTAPRLLAMLVSGELAKLARSSPDQPTFAATLGLSPAAYRGCVARLRKIGKEFPGYEELRELRGGKPPIQPAMPNPGITIPDTGTREEMIAALAEFDEAITQEVPIVPPAAEKFPSLAAFDDPPLFAMSKGYRVKGVSTLVDADGQTKAQWIKTTAEDDGREKWLDAIRLLGQKVEPFAPVGPLLATCNDDLLAVYPIGDPHIGLLSWHEDAGANFDLGIAERNLVGAIDCLVELADPATNALIIAIGDNTHSDGQSNTTTKGTRVDVDGRTAKMMATTIRTFRRAISLALGKHQHVTLIVERGNHDELLSLMLALALAQYYENEPRVTIDVSPEMFHWYRFGKVLIGSHHGHNAKPMDLLGVMAVDRQEDWGQTQFRRMYCGHYHHLMTKEVPGMVIDYLPTLAASDAWHRAMGYRSQRAMYMDMYDRNEGHANRHIVGIQRVMRHLREAA